MFLAENLIKKKSKNRFKYVIFRYFNVAGSLIKSNLGETKDPLNFYSNNFKNIIYKKNLTYLIILILSMEQV